MINTEVDALDRSHSYTMPSHPQFDAVIQVVASQWRRRENCESWRKRFPTRKEVLLRCRPLGRTLPSLMPFADACIQATVRLSCRCALFSSKRHHLCPLKLLLCDRVLESNRIDSTVTLVNGSRTPVVNESEMCGRADLSDWRFGTRGWF